MKLSELLKLRQELLSVDISQLESLSKKLSANTNAIDFLSYDSSGVLDSVAECKNNLVAIREKIAESVAVIDLDIARLDIEYKAKCREEERFHLRASIQDNRELRKYFMHPNAREVVIGRLGQYTNWKYPGIEIGPGDGQWTNHLVGMDPLYLVDVYEEFLNSTKLKFHPVYQSRLRTYKIPHGDLSALPEKQFGFVFSWNVFNYFSLDTICLYLEKIKPLMRPGGVVMFSYNNCENYKSAELFENRYMTYVPNKDLSEKIKEMGYKIITARNEPTSVSWIEIKVPGELSSIRAGQTLGKIKTLGNESSDTI